MSRLGQNGEPAEVNVWPIAIWVEKLKTIQKWFGVHSLELFAANNRPFQIKKFIHKDSVRFLAEETQLYELTWTEGLVSRNKSLVYSKMSKQNENLSKNGSEYIFRNFSQPIPHRFKWRKLSLKTRSPFRRRHSSYESSWREGSVRRSKSLVYSKMSKKTENLSKMARVALFGTICSQCRTVSNK